VVFWDDLLEELHATDPDTARLISDGAFAWDGHVLELRGAVAAAEGSGYSIARVKLLDILTARAIELGVDIQFDHEVTNPAALSEADVVVASDGAGSNLRQLQADRFGPKFVLGRNKYIWLGTTKVFRLFTFPYVHTSAGWIWGHAYAFDDHTSTFIVECPPETWTGLGFDTLTTRDGLRKLEELFEHHLDGASLMSPSGDDAPLPWLNFRTITNDCWHSGNTVLMGDAAHTAHFSIGSGTRLAMQDAMVLAAELQRQATTQLAFAAYERTRKTEMVRALTDARLSAKWLENVDRYIDLSAPVFYRLFQARRDPLVHRVPPKLYYWIYTAVDRFAFLRKFRGWIMPKVRALQLRRAARH
jgi:2-polyprenyl-6-methoxyphenol hydroxylase-like FAD-dependent oxidoreductase